jgi:hypothetical protein
VVVREEKQMIDGGGGCSGGEAIRKVSDFWCVRVSEERSEAAVE